jgi:hypothetical protein
MLELLLSNEHPTCQTIFSFAHYVSQDCKWNRPIHRLAWTRGKDHICMQALESSWKAIQDANQFRVSQFKFDEKMIYLTNTAISNIVALISG